MSDADYDAGVVHVVTGDVGAACGVYATHEAAEAAVDAHFSEYASGVTVEERGRVSPDRWQVYFRIGSFPSMLGHAVIRRESVRGSRVTSPAGGRA